MREKINLFKDDENIKKLSEKELARKSKLSRRLQRRMLKIANGKIKEEEDDIIGLTEE